MQTVPATDVTGHPYPDLTERQRREREFYQEFVKRTGDRDLSLAAVDGRESRPWNPYWYACSIVRDAYLSGARRLLDFGCGSGAYSVLFAHLGYEVHGFDVSPANVEAARARAERFGVRDRTNFSVQTAESLDFPSEYFDIAVGMDILHHVEVSVAITECFRTLKPAGLAVFNEPVETPVFDRIRRSALGRRLVSTEMSLDRQVTADERKLTPLELDIVQRACSSYDVRRFLLLSRFDKFFRVKIASFSVLERLDQWLLDAFPFPRRFAGKAVLTLRK
jgi:ubiquinone/menaquinone biosynthesis C-methylase UbiE